MRPGPGLVVMALAFISGARRGSTSSISSKTTTTSSPPPPTLQILTTTTPASSLTLFQTTVTTLPTSSSSFSFISSTTSTTTSTPPTTGDTITTTSSPPPPTTTTQPIKFYENFDFFGSHLFKEQENDHQNHLRKRPKEPVPFNFLNTFFTRNSYNSNPSTSNYFAYTYPLPSHLTQHYDDPRARTESNSVLHSAKHTRRATAKFRRRRKRRTRSANVNYRGSGTGSDDATENLNDSDDTLTSLTTAVDSSSDSVLSDQTTLARGLPVHFPSLTAADSSRSLDEDDIFALVAEDDLLSEESFDHLVKLTNDKIGDTNEEDYSSGTETVVESSSGSGSGAPDNVLDAPDQQNAIEDFVREHRQQQQQQQEEHDQQQDHKENSQDDNNVDDNGDKEKPNEDHDSEQDDVDTIYTAHLVGNSNEKVVSLAETDSIHSHTDPVGAIEKEENLARATTTTTTRTTKEPKAELDSPNRYHTILGSHFALTRLNPWISACDLAQPGPLSAPDLQGECSAGTLPVAWVDEGPGPPTCLKSCKEETPFTNKLNKDNMINNLINNNNSNNNNNNNSKQNKKYKNDNKLNKLVGYTTTTNTFNIKLRNSQPTISHSMNTNNNNNNNKHMDNNNNNNNMKLLNPFNYYQINNYNNNNNNNKMAKIRRNSKETTSDHSDVATKSTTTTTANVTTTHTSDQSQDKLSVSLHSSEDYDLLHDMLMQQDEAATNKKQNQQQYNDDGDDDGDEDQRHQFNDAAIAAAAVVMQLNHQQQQQQQQQAQNHNNNNIVKMKLTTTTTTNYNDNNSNNNNNNQYDLKYNHLKQDHVGNANHNNNNNNNMNRRYHSNSNNINNAQQRSDNSAATPKTTTTTTNHAVAANNDNSDQYLNISPPQPPPPEKQQQCLEYLGDSDTTMPTHLCHLLTPSDRLAQLRHLRLRNCCERNVYSALHTMALNATLSGGAGCLRVLQDLMDLDALASRITCGLTEILFRFDCRQVYSIIHQCDDCKEAYRRWVCSTLVPYFAETSDIMKPPEILTTTTIESTSVGSGGSNGAGNSPSQSYKKSQINSFNSSSSSSSNNTTMASNMTTSHTATTSTDSNNINNNGTDMSSAMPTKQATSNFITNNNNNNNNNKHDMQYNANNYQQQQQQQHYYKQQQQQQQHHVKRRNVQKQQHIVNHILIDNSSSMVSNNNSNNNNKNHNKINDIHYKTILTIHHKNQPSQQQLHPSTISQALIFNDIITLNPRTTSPRNPLRRTTTTTTTTRLQSFNATNEAAFGLNFHHKSTNKRRRKRSDNSTSSSSSTTTTIFADVVVNRPSMSSTPSLSSSSLSSSSSSTSTMMHQLQRQNQQQQSFNFISTANNEDSFYAKNPVITKLLKRSKRKEFEFRKRRRIRPCLSVCQTVEQKCPYLLPADRAPSMPTQYAGEPTFLCLDYNIAETKEQLEKASHGPNDCCYTYCSNSGDGICTYCNDMWDKTEIEKEVEILSEERETKVFNITMKTKGRGDSSTTNIRVETKIQQKIGEEKNGLKMSTVAIAVRNDTAFENATMLAERLQYYAFCDGVFYYDDDADDMPEYPSSENCRELPAVQSRCIPYYATNYISSADMLGSYRKNNEAQKLLIWLSTLLCLWSCYSARSMRMRRYNEDKKQQQSEQQLQQELTHQKQLQKQHKTTTNTAYKGGNMCQSCQTREIMQNEGNCEKIIKLWYDDKEYRIIIIYWLKIANVTKTTATTQHKKSLRAKFLLERHFRQILRSTSVKLNLKILEIPSLILLINYKEILLLLFKKRQKLRKRKMKSFPATAGVGTTTERVIIVKGKCWPLLRDLRFKIMKSKPKKCSFKDKNYYYDYYNYYYCSCSQIFSCSCNKNINNNNYYYNNIKYIKKFKYNFSTCNFNKNTNNNYKNNNKNKNHKNNNNNKMMIMKINYKKVSIIKFNTTTTTTHIFIINSYNYNNKNNNIRNYYNIITFITKSYNIYNNLNSKPNFNSFNSISNNNHYHHLQHHHYYYNYNDYYYNNYNYASFKSNNNNNKNIMINNNTVTLKIFTALSNGISKSLTIFQIMNTIMILLLMLIMSLLFKSFLKMKYNNNHHMKNIINSNLSHSPNTSYNSKKTNYRYFYYYNFNINDWWQRRRWCRRKRRHHNHKHHHHQQYTSPTTSSSSTSYYLMGKNHHFVSESLLLSVNGVSSQAYFVQFCILL